MDLIKKAIKIVKKVRITAIVKGAGNTFFKILPILSENNTFRMEDHHLNFHYHQMMEYLAL